MPELPEVETIRRDLSKTVLGKKIIKVGVGAPQIVAPKGFAKKIIGLKFKKISRRAKLLIFKFSDDKTAMLTHLKMTGQLVYRNEIGKVEAVGGHPIKQDLQILPNKFSRVIFSFEGGGKMFFNDVRKFGYLKLVKVADLPKIESAYGVEPFTKDFTLKNFVAVLKKRPNLKIKQLLMDQSLVAGIGNIYSDEVCYHAGIRPTRPSGSLTSAEIKKIFQAILKVLKLALEKRGTSADDYVDAYGRRGDFVRFLKVYGRKGEKCKKCNTLLKTLRLSGRTSNYCPRCQK